jgi:CRP/FNR family transcriptional regulator, cyclic AMP receptor protein
MNTFGLTADSDLQATLRTFASQSVERKVPEFLFHQGEKPHGCYLIKSGKVRLSMEAEPGHSVLRRVVGPGCVVGLPASINGRVYSLNCEVVEDAELAYLSCQDLALLIKSDTGAAMKLLDLLSSEVQAVRSEFANSSRS